MKKLFTLLLLMLSPLVYGQHTGNGGSIAWVVLDSTYHTSPFNDTTKVDIWFDGSAYSGNVTSVQFKVKYDGLAFESVYEVSNNLDTNSWTLSYNDDTDANTVLISFVNTAGQSTTIPDTNFVTIKLKNIHNKLLYSNEQNITNFTFAGYDAVGSDDSSQDIEIGEYSHGGDVKIPHRRFKGYVLDYHTGKGIPSLEYRLQRNNTTVATVLGGQPTVTSNSGYYEMVYYEYFYGYIQANTDFDFFFKTEDLDSDAALSTADAYKLLLFANDKETFTAIQTLQGDVNHSHTITIADAQAKFAYQAGTYTGWGTLGQGGYRDIMIIKPEDIKYLTTDVTTVTQLGRGPLGFEPQNTNWTYDLNAYNGIADTDENFYVVIMGDVNGTSIGGTVPQQSAKSVPENIPLLGVDTSILAQLPDKTVVAGDEFKVDLVLNTKKQDVHSFNFELEYDPEVLEFIDASTPYLPNAWMLYFNANEIGMVNYGGMDGSSGNFPIRTDTTETIIQFTFKAINETGIGETPIEFGDKYNTGDRLGDDLPTQVVDGKVYMQVISSMFEDGEFPKGFQLGQNYPNPFNPETTIPFTIVSPQRVSVDIYRVDGTFVENVYNKFSSTGNYFVRFNAENLPSGVYFYRLTTDKGTETKKLILVK